MAMVHFTVIVKELHRETGIVIGRRDGPRPIGVPFQALPPFLLAHLYDCRTRIPHHADDVASLKRALQRDIYIFKTGRIPMAEADGNLF